MDILWWLIGSLSFFQKPDAFQRYFAASPSLWFDQGMLFQQLNNWQSQKPNHSFTHDHSRYT